MLDPSNLEEFKNETYLLSTLRHPSVVNFYGISVDGVTGDVYIVTELACCSVNVPLYNPQIEMSVGSRAKIAVQTAQGMGYLHSQVLLIDCTINRLY
jgi:serine/threonine protein kinase